MISSCLCWDYTLNLSRAFENVLNKTKSCNFDVKNESQFSFRLVARQTMQQLVDSAFLYAKIDFLKVKSGTKSFLQTIR